MNPICTYAEVVSRRSTTTKIEEKTSNVVSGLLVVGAPRFELGTPSPPDWCANRAALRSDRHRHYNFEWDQSQQVQNCKDFAIVPYGSALKFMPLVKGRADSCSRSSHALLSSPSLCGQTGNRTKRWSEGHLCSMTIWFARASFSFGET